MSDNNIMKLFIMFIGIMIIAFFAIGFSSTVTAPAANTSAGQQYTNLSTAVGLAGNGMTAVMLIIIFAMVLSAAFFIIKMVKK